ncbi:potassium channel family protein [Kushneria aurantia]|uniref:Potassium channel family protein n=1 Tax=Kushneria aurantia TaxID=504092 RepID=A0ABV6G6E8_9GAMM|nr:TrkA family potassium uptake protein [Kushneria aurantia]
MSRQYAIIGLDYFGKTVALELMNQRHEVLGVDYDEGRVDALADQLTHTVIADARDERALQELDLQRFDAVLIDLGTIESSILCAMHLRNLEVRELWVRALSDDHYKLLNHFGVDRIVYPEHDHGVHVAQSLNHRSVVDMIELGDDQYVVEVEITAELVKIRGDEGGVRVGTHESARLVAIKRDEELDCSPDADTLMQPGDRAILIGHLDALKQFDAEQPA